MSFADIAPIVLANFTVPIKDTHIIEDLERDVLPKQLQGLDHDIYESDLNKPFQGAEDVVFEGIDLFLSQVFPKAYDFLQADHTVWEYISYFKWVFNFLFLGIPWMLLCIALVVADIWVNISINEWWADGNVFLIANSLFLFWQAVLSVPLVIEIPSFLRQMKVVRAFNALSGLLFTVVYLAMGASLIYTIDLEPISEDMDAMTAMQVMFVAYNLIMATPAFPVIMVSLGKEIALQTGNTLLIQDDKMWINNSDMRRSFQPSMWLIH